MRLLLSSIFSLLVALGAAAQEAEVTADTTAVEVSEPEAPPAVLPDTAVAKSRGFRLQPVLLIDYGKLVSTAAGFDKKYEGAVQLLINDRIELVGEFGKADLAPENAYTNGNYESSGSYFRVGAGIYSRLNPKSKIGIGLRYGAASFQDQGLIEIESASGVQEPYTRAFAHDNLKASWWSAVLTSESKVVLRKAEPEARVNQLFSIGFQVRMRFLISYDRQTPVDVFSIPGYGSTLNDQSGAFNLFVKLTPF